MPPLADINFGFIDGQGLEGLGSQNVAALLVQNGAGGTAVTDTGGGGGGGGGANIVIDLTAAVNGVTPNRLLGYASGIMGAVSPTTMNGPTIAGIYIQEATSEWRVVLDGNQLQTLFTSITVNGFTFLSAAATFLAGVTTLWAWPGNAYPGPLTLGAGAYTCNFAIP